jgi:AraC-like DNA-binding protein
MKKLGVFRAMLVSYLLIILVPMSVFLYASIYVVSANYQQHILEIRSSALRHSTALLDQRIRECKALANQITLNPFITRQQLEEAYTGSIALSELNSMKTTNEFITEIGIYYFGGKYIYLSRGATDPGVACKEYFDLDADDTERLLDALNNASAPHLVALRGQGRLFYLIPLPANNTHSYGVSLFLFDNTALQSLFDRDSYASGDRHLWAYETGEVLYKALNTPALDTALLDECFNANWITLTGIRYRILRAASQVVPGLHALTFVNEISLQPLPEGFWLLMLVFIGVIVICMYLATLFTSRYWRSFRELGLLVFPNVNHSTQWETIQSAVHAALTSNNDLRHQLEVHLNVMRENLLLRLIEGETSQPENIVEEMRDAGLDAALNSGAILAIKVDAEPTGLSEQVLQWMTERHPHDGSAVEIGGVNCVIAAVFLNSTHDTGHDEGGEDTKPRATAQAIAYMLQAAGIQGVYIGVGRITPLHELRWSYLQAVAALEHGVAGGIHIADFSSATHASGYVVLYDEKQMILSIAVRQGDAALAEQMVRDIVTKACQEAPSVYHYVCISLINWALDSTKDDDTRGKLRNLICLLDRVTPGEFTQRLVDVLGTLCQEHRIWNKKLDSEYTQSILDYVSKAFTDPNFSLEALSDAFGSSSTYWSRFFKDRVGEGFSDYLWKLRLNLAKRLLNESGLPINTIVERIGYSDARSFIRKFKVSEGMTPGQFRKMIQTGIPTVSKNGGREEHDYNYPDDPQ